jgi:hypothetical protein
MNRSFLFFSRFECETAIQDIYNPERRIVFLLIKIKKEGKINHKAGGSD